MEMWSRVESRYLKLMRERRREQAAEMLKAEYAIARRAKDAESATLIRSLLVSSLIASGKDDEAVEILREAQRDDESNVLRRLQLATQLC